MTGAALTSRILVVDDDVQLLDVVTNYLKREGCEEDDRILGFAQGADDYLTKPFSPRELTKLVDFEVAAGATLGEQRRVRVDDECGGILPAELKRVFDTAFRSDTARNRDHAGGGLGLPIARGLADLVGGTLNVENIEGGCRFLLTVPLDVAATSPHDLQQLDLVEVGDRSVIVIGIGETAIDA